MTSRGFGRSTAASTGHRSSTTRSSQYSTLRGLFLALFPLAQLARDGNTEPAPGSTGIRFTIGVVVDTAEDVDRLTEQMRRAGARVTEEPVDAEFFTGRSAYLRDPEGNYFEITWADLPDNPIVAAARRVARA